MISYCLFHCVETWSFRLSVSNRKLMQDALISSDFYLRKCENLRPQNLEEFERLLNDYRSTQQPLSVFLNGSNAEKIFAQNISYAPLKDISIYIHSDDRIPSAELMEKMTRHGFKLYSVNWIGDLEFCTPIPIGIPPGSFNNFHGTYIYDNIVENAKINERIVKFPFYLNFDLTTNIIQRKLALENFAPLDDTFIPKRRLSHQEHLKAISESQYVVSPPGAGADCYRTWEAIYLGAIPIVLEEYWPFKHLDLPVLVVKSYADFLVNYKRSEVKFLPRVTTQFVLELPNEFR